MSDDIQKLHRQLIELNHQLREHTQKTYERINPFQEDLFPWKERGEFRFGKGKNITLYNSSTVIGDVEVGENTWIGPNTTLDGNGGLKIGKFCSISTGVHIWTHDTARWSLSGGKAEYEYSPVSIGDCCYLGTGAIVVRGVTIGNHCLIGAGAVVTESLPDYSIALGVPARVVGRAVVDGEKVKYEYFTR